MECVRRRKKKVKSCFFRDPLLISKTPLLSGFSDFCSPILRVREGCVYSRIHSGLCLLYCQKMIGRNIQALARNVRTFLELQKKTLQLCRNCMNKIYFFKRKGVMCYLKCNFLYKYLLNAQLVLLEWSYSEVELTETTLSGTTRQGFKWAGMYSEKLISSAGSLQGFSLCWS